MSYVKFESHLSMTAPDKKYTFDPRNPVKLLVPGTNHYYCNLKQIYYAELLSLIEKVGKMIEQKTGAQCFNVIYSFICTNEDVKDGEANKALFNRLFCILTNAIKEKKGFSIAKADVFKITLKKSIDKTRKPWQPMKAYECEVSITSACTQRLLSQLGIMAF